MFSSFLVSELALILAPTGQTNIFTYLFPNRITYQHILFLHQLFLFFSVALSRVAPLFSPPEEDPRLEKAILEKTQILASMADREGKASFPPYFALTFFAHACTISPFLASIILHADFHTISPSTVSPATGGRATMPLLTPLSPNETLPLLQSLAPKMRDLITEHNLKKDSGPLRSAWELAVQRGRMLSSSTTTDSGDPDSSHIQATSNMTKNFWEVTPGAADPSGSAIIDGSTYYVVDDHHSSKDTAEDPDKPELSNVNEPFPSPRPSPPRSRPASPVKRSSRELLVD